MFGKKAPDNLPADGVRIQTQVIPPEFYAGLNPVVKFKEIKKEIVLNEAGQVLSKSEQNLIKQAKTAGGQNKLHPANLFTSRKFFIIAGAGLFVLFSIGGGLYYWWQINAQSNSTPTPPVVAYIPTPEPVVQPALPTPPVIEPVVLTPPLSLQEPPITFLPTSVGESADLDNDGISDVAEAMFNTDPSVPDTDGDSYIDGSEVYHIYDPAKKTPAKLIDSGTIKEFDNPVFGYKVYYPASWEVGNVDQKYHQGLFSALNGENIEIRVFDLEMGKTFVDWFSQWAPSERYADLLFLESMFGDKGQRRPDDLVNYFLDNAGHVYVLVYHNIDDTAPINYRIVSKMFARSFRLTGNYSPLPEQPVVDELAPGGITNEPEVLNSSTVGSVLNTSTTSTL